MASLTLVGGGSRSGKSRFAVELAQGMGERRIFIATAEATDSEMRDRIHRHQTDRGESFVTIECPVDVPDAVAANGSADVLVLDCLSLWLSNRLSLDHADAAILQGIDALVSVVRSVHAHVIVVSNEVGMGLVSLNQLGRRFQDLSGWSHQRLALAATEIYLATLGCVLRLKPDPISRISPC